MGESGGGAGLVIKCAAFVCIIIGLGCGSHAYHTFFKDLSSKDVDEVLEKKQVWRDTDGKEHTLHYYKLLFAFACLISIGFILAVASILFGLLFLMGCMQNKLGKCLDMMLIVMGAGCVIIAGFCTLGAAVETELRCKKDLPLSVLPGTEKCRAGDYTVGPVAFNGFYANLLWVSTAFNMLGGIILLIALSARPKG